MSTLETAIAFTVIITFLTFLIVCPEELALRSIEDVKRLDQQHMTSVQNKKETVPEGSLPGRVGSVRPASNSFHNFNQRQYNYSSLESALADTNRRSR